MNYYKLYINFEESWDTFNSITSILNVNPTPHEKSKFSSDTPALWVYEVEKKEEDEYFDFINKFLEILEPNFKSLEKLKIKKSDITFWKLYEYNQQCAMEFHPQEMKRLGDNGISLCIDCWEKDS